MGGGTSGASEDGEHRGDVPTKPGVSTFPRVLSLSLACPPAPICHLFLSSASRLRQPLSACLFPPPATTAMARPQHPTQYAVHPRTCTTAAQIHIPVIGLPVLTFKLSSEFPLTVLCMPLVPRHQHRPMSSNKGRMALRLCLQHVSLILQDTYASFTAQNRLHSAKRTPCGLHRTHQPKFRAARKRRLTWQQKCSHPRLCTPLVRQQEAARRGGGTSGAGEDGRKARASSVEAGTQGWRAVRRLLEVQLR